MTESANQCASRLEQAPILIATRFSFFGKSGWKSDASHDTELLFHPDRLHQRLRLFRAVNLASLALQGDPDFHHLILTSSALPEWAMTELQSACLTAYGDPQRFTILARRPCRARVPLREFMQDRFANSAVVQVVLDDDDGLATDFVSTLRRDLRETEKQLPEVCNNLPYFVSYPLGYGLSLRNEADRPADLYLHRYPYINLGLTLIGQPEGKNIFAIDHRAAPRRYGARLLGERTMFVRSLHDFNDSRVTVGEKWRVLDSWTKEPELQNRFPYLFQPGAPWKVPNEF